MARSTTPAWTPALAAAFEQAWRAAGSARRSGALDAAFVQLERAHILGQRRIAPLFAPGPARRD